jgi:hypothetical protein
MRYIPWVGMSIYLGGSVIAMYLSWTNIVSKDTAVGIAILSLLIPLGWFICDGGDRR